VVCREISASLSLRSFRALHMVAHLQVGSDEAFDGWLKAYVAAYAFQSILAEEMFAHFLAHFPHLAQAGIATRYVSARGLGCVTHNLTQIKSVTAVPRHRVEKR
jgi:hypothetical protein